MSYIVIKHPLNSTINLVFWPNFALILCPHATNTLYVDQSKGEAKTMLICTEFNV